MKQPSVDLKMRILGAVDTVEGRTRHERVHNVASMTFLDEEGHPRRPRPAPRRRRQRTFTPKGTSMIRSDFGRIQNPFDRRELDLLPVE